MSLTCIKLYMDGFWIQRAFHRVQERANWSSNEKVMAVQIWRLHMNNDLRSIFFFFSFLLVLVS